MYSKQCHYGSKEVVGQTELCHRLGAGAVREERENGLAAMKAGRHEEGMKLFLFSFALLCFNTS